MMNPLLTLFVIRLTAILTLSLIVLALPAGARGHATCTPPVAALAHRPAAADADLQDMRLHD